MRKIKILFVAANPKNTISLQLDEEIRTITEKIRASDYRDLMELVSIWATHPDDLLQALNVHKPDIVHFSGHGSKSGEIMFVDNDGLAIPVPPRALKALFKTMKDNVRVVLLNTCFSHTQAAAITSVIDCAIGMKESIGDHSATIFAASFYRAIGFGRSIDEAFRQAKLALILEGIHDDLIPKILVKKGIDVSKVVLIDSQNLEGIPFDEAESSEKHKKEIDFILPVKPTDIETNTPPSRNPIITHILDRIRGKKFLEIELPDIVIKLKADTVTIALLDVDDLSLINKHYGEIVGNKVLEKIAYFLFKDIPEGHFVGRCGDDTFFIVFLYMAENKATGMCYKLVKTLANFKWEKIASKLRVTCSLGFATKHPGEPVLDTIVRAAIGMTGAKVNGKNVVEIAPLFLNKHQSRDLGTYYS